MRDYLVSIRKKRYRCKWKDRLAPQLQWSKCQSSPVQVLSVKEDRNIYSSDFIFQFVHTLNVLLELKRGSRGRDRMVVGFTTTCAISAYNQVVRSNPVHGEVYSIQHYVIKFVRDFLPFFLPINLIVTIWLKCCWKWRYAQ
jgi:hypothetical protein